MVNYNKLKSYFVYLSTFLNIVLLIKLYGSDLISFYTVKLDISDNQKVQCRAKGEAQFKSSVYFQSMSNMTEGVAESRTIADIVQVVLYNFSRPLADHTKHIPCALLKKSKPPYYVCLHDSIEDSFSRVIVEEGGMEPYVQDLMKSFFLSNPDAFFFDLGMNIGTHSLYAALLNPKIKVLGVEPFPKNVIRGHKAAYLNKVQDRIQVVMAAISGKRGLVDFTEPLDNTGANTLINAESHKFAKMPKKGFSSFAILFNDLLPFVPGTKALLKMDIEAQECYAFFNADKIFDKLDIPLIIMEHARTFDENPPYCVEAMLKFLEIRNYGAYHFSDKENDANNVRTPLNMTDWRNWGDLYVYFKRLK